MEKSVALAVYVTVASVLVTSVTCRMLTSGLLPAACVMVMTTGDLPDGVTVISAFRTTSVVLAVNDTLTVLSSCPDKTSGIAHSQFDPIVQLTLLPMVN